jgi:hypothetical protein
MLSASYHVMQDTVIKVYSSTRNVHYLTLGKPGCCLCDLTLFMTTPEDVQKLVEGLQKLQAAMEENIWLVGV